MPLNLALPALGLVLWPDLFIKPQRTKFKTIIMPSSTIPRALDRTQFCLRIEQGKSCSFGVGTFPFGRAIFLLLGAFRTIPASCSCYL